MNSGLVKSARLAVAKWILGGTAEIVTRPQCNCFLCDTDMGLDAKHEWHIETSNYFYAARRVHMAICKKCEAAEEDAG